jgi:hypothetical protein
MPQARSRRSRKLRLREPGPHRVRTGHDFRVRDPYCLAVDDTREHRLELGPTLAYIVAVLNDVGRLAAQESGLIDRAVL